MTGSLYERLQSYVGKPAGSPVTASEPVNKAMIAHWCDAMGDRNPLYAQGEVAPPAMLQVWTMRRYAADHPLRGAYEVLGMLDEAGFPGVVATNCDHEYVRYLAPGDVVTEEVWVDSVSEEKNTALGRGHFVTFRHEFRDGAGELVGRMRFRVLKFRPPEEKKQQPVGTTDGAAASGGPIRPRHPRPAINRDNAFFWEGVARGELLLQRCADCGQLRHPPGPMCPSCHSLRWETRPASGRGVVHSYVVMHYPAIPPFEMPHPVVLVDLEEGVRFVAGIRGVAPENIRIGMPVEVEFIEVEPGFRVPGFRPRSG